MRKSNISSPLHLVWKIYEWVLINGTVYKLGKDELNFVGILRWWLASHSAGKLNMTTLQVVLHSGLLESKRWNWNLKVNGLTHLVSLVLWQGIQIDIKKISLTYGLDIKNPDELPIVNSGNWNRPIWRGSKVFFLFSFYRFVKF